MISSIMTIEWQIKKLALENSEISRKEDGQRAIYFNIFELLTEKNSKCTPGIVEAAIKILL